MKSQKEFFNSMAAMWDEISKHDMGKVEYILDLMDIKPGDYILDVGTGTGILIPSLYKRTTSIGIIKAVDLSENMIVEARIKNNFENVEYYCGDVLEMEDGNNYDHIICYSMFPHFKSRQAQAIKILSQKLAPNGKLMISHSQSREEINDLHKDVEKPVKEDNLPTMEVLESYFLDANLNVVMKIDSDEMFVIIGCREAITS